MVWATVDIAMAIMTITNLVALILLSKWGLAALRDYERQRKAGVAEPVFVAAKADLPGELNTGVW